MTSSTPLRRATFVLTLLLASTAANADAVPLGDPGFTDAITEQLRTALPDEHVVVVAPQRLTIGNAGASVSLARLWQSCQATPARCDAESAAFVAGTTKVYLELNQPPEPAQVRLALRSTAAAQANMAHSRATGLNLQMQPFVEGLVSVVVVDARNTVRWASSHDLETLKLDPAGLRDLARNNTHAGMQPLMSVATPAGKGQIGVIDSADEYTSSRMLFPADWAPLAKAQQGVLIVAVPRPNTIVYVGDDAAASVDALRTLARQKLGESRDGLSDRLLRWTPDGWKPLP